MARRVVDLARRALDRLEDDVFVEAGAHSVRELEPRRIDSVEPLTGDGILPGRDLVEAPHLYEPDRARELAHPEVQPVEAVVGFSVVAEPARELDDVVPPRDEHAALAGGDGLRGGE